VVTKFIYTLRIMILHVALKTHYIPVVKDVTGFMLVVAGSHVISLAFFHIFFANLRCFWLSIVLIFSRRKTQIELIFVDQVSLPVLIVRCLSNIRTIFYCHYPDSLLAPRNSIIRMLYRFPYDLLEKYSTLCAHKILVNSKFTAQKFLNAFLNVESLDCPDVLYPSVIFRFSASVC